MKNIETEVITTAKQVSDLVDWLVIRHAPPAPYSPTMYLDLEGVNLCREGSLSILTMLIDTGIPTKRIYLIDVHTLGARAFNTAGARQKTLKDILQDEMIPKVFFDVRNDSDALFAHFSVALQGVEDVQLMESASRKITMSRRFVTSLTKCVENNMHLDVASWRLAKAKGERLFKTIHGGSYDVFNKRPVPNDIVDYCVGDVLYLPALRDKFWKQRTLQWQNLVNEETKKRVAMSQKSDYQPHDPEKTKAPWSECQNGMLDQWNYVPSLYDCDAYVVDGDGDYDEDDWFHDDGPTSCRDIISDCDHDLYYSD